MIWADEQAAPAFIPAIYFYRVPTFPKVILTTTSWDELFPFSAARLQTINNPNVNVSIKKQSQ